MYLGPKFSVFGKYFLNGKTQPPLMIIIMRAQRTTNKKIISIFLSSDSRGSQANFFFVYESSPYTYTTSMPYNTVYTYMLGSGLRQIP